jgi:hypothetical protein
LIIKHNVVKALQQEIMSFISQNDNLLLKDLVFLNKKKINLRKPTLELFTLRNQKYTAHLFNSCADIDNEIIDYPKYIRENRLDNDITTLKNFLNLLREQNIILNNLKQELIAGYRMA